jgi:aerobic carbon-monoxide dehydrogenase small subunit
MSITLKINSEEVTTHCGPLTPLIDLLRDELQLTGAKPVCLEGFCGACTVLIDGMPRMSCLAAIGLLENKEICTIESLDKKDSLSRLQLAFEEADAVQCGMCFPGMVMSLTGNLSKLTATSTRDDVKALLSGNICRCTGYERIVDAVIEMLAIDRDEEHDV